MKNMFAIALISAALAATSMSSSYAIEPPADKKFTLDFSNPGVGTGEESIGGRMFLSPDIAIEAEVSLQLDGKDNDAGLKGGTSIFIAGGVMKYLSKGRVSPYMHGGGAIELYFGDRYDGKDNDVKGYGGIGAEFMITEELSLRTSVDAILAISPFKIATVTSGLTLSFFF